MDRSTLAAEPRVVPQGHDTPTPTNSLGLSSLAIHGGPGPDPTTGALLAPICQSTTFSQAGVGQDKGYTYTRTGNPTVAALEQALGRLEDAPPAVCTATGMAALTVLCLGLLKADDHVVVFNTGAVQKYVEFGPRSLPRLALASLDWKAIESA